MKCKLFFIILILFLYNFGYARATPEQEKFINSLSSEQLYEIYAKQVVSYIQQTDRSRFLYNKREKVKKCLINILKMELNNHDIRILFIQPVTMDRDYYNRKLDMIGYRSALCVQQP